MTQSENILKAIVLTKELGGAIDKIISDNRMGDAKVRELEAHRDDLYLTLIAIEDYQADFNEYVESGEHDRDIKEGEILR